MQRICHVIIVLLGLSVLPALADDAVAPMALDFRVDENGAATFALPINVPTGRGEMRPQVGLGYSSQNSSDGPLGIGWYLQAASAITRCRKTPFDDGEVSTVTLTSSDRFCLDGQRLHLVSGSYGAAGSTYRLNGQPGTLITAHGGSLANGPDYFERVTKAKEVSYFGNAFYATGLSSDAAAVSKPGNNSVVSAWMMSSVEDVARNYIQYLYTTNNLSGESYLSEIRYSGNHTTGELPYIRIIFDHVAKAQPRNGYQAGYPITQSQQWYAVSD